VARGFGRSLSDLAFAEIERFVVGSFALVFVAVCGGILILVLWNRMNFLWHLLIALGVLTVVSFAVRRLRELKRLCDRGVEVEAHLVRVWDSQGAETDFRHADYTYEWAGHSHEFTVRGADFFMSLATRYGDNVIVLVDPERPQTTAILRSM
jgi:hypothetical protein